MFDKLINEFNGNHNTSDVLSNKQKKQHFISLFLFFALLVVFWGEAGCSGRSEPLSRDSLLSVHDQVKVYYELDQPDHKYFMPNALEEISGLSFLPNGHLIGIADEKGKAYDYDLVSQKVVGSIHFAGPGDYEGIEVVGDSVWVLESNGDLYHFGIGAEDPKDTQKYETRLNKDNNAEGLALNPLTGNLLIACKENGDVKGVEVKGRAVYEWDLHKRKIVKEPYFQVTSKMLEHFFEANRDFDYDVKRIRFEPSAIAFNPLDHYFYMLASAGKLMVVLDREGNIVASYAISARILTQPEGIAFTEKGEMYICSEGAGASGYILQYTPRNR